MIQSITLDFGPYYHTTIELGNLTVVTSDTPDRGKTWAVIRSLQWCLFNQGYYHDDDAKDEIRHRMPDGSKSSFAQVRVTFTDERWIERYRDSSTNRYTIFDGEEERTYSAVGQGFFEPVREILGIGPVALDGKNEEIVNVHGFYDPTFLLSKSPAQIDTILSRLMGGDTIEDAGRAITADLRNLKGELKSLGARIEEAASQLSALPDLDGARGLLDRADAETQTLTAQRGAAQALQRGGEVLRRATHAAVGVRHKLQSAQPPLSRAAVLLKQVEETSGAIEKTRRLQSILAQMRGVADEAENLRGRLLAGELVSNADRLASAAELINGEIATLRSAVQRVSAADQAVNAARGANAQAQDAAAGAQQAFKDAMREAGVCPLCGSSTEHFHEETP